MATITATITDPITIAEPESSLPIPLQPLSATPATPAIPAPTHTYPSGLHLHLIFLSLTLALLLGGLDANILAPALPHITDSFHTTTDVGWYASSYRLAACSLQLFFGKCYKIFPAKWLFVLSNVVFLLGSVLSAAAVSTGMLILGRAVTGAGLAGAAAGLYVILLRVLPPARRPVGMSLVGAVEGVAIVIAPVLGKMSSYFSILILDEPEF